MSDSIERQAAIDLINDIDLINFTAKGVIRDRLRKLPSVQPEIIRCKDCKYGNPNGEYGCKCYHYRLYETHEMKPEDFCSRAERRTDERSNQQEGGD